MKEEGIPFRSVFDRSFDTKSVIAIPSKIIAVSMSPAASVRKEAKVAAKKIVMMAIRVGNAPPSKGKVYRIYTQRRSFFFRRR